MEREKERIKDAFDDYGSRTPMAMISLLIIAIISLVGILVFWIIRLLAGLLDKAF